MKKSVFSVIVSIALVGLMSSCNGNSQKEKREIELHQQVGDKNMDAGEEYERIFREGCKEAQIETERQTQEDIRKIEEADDDGSQTVEYVDNSEE